MNKIKAVVAVVALGFVVFVLDGIRHRIDPQGTVNSGSMVAAARAGASCPVPGVDQLAGVWHVTSAACVGSCNQSHFALGDTMRFDRNVSGETNFSLASVPSDKARRASRSIGYALESDGVGNVTGPIVLDHNPLDGSVLNTHWMIVKVRSYDATGLGDCKLHGVVAVCDQEPATGSGVCSSQQHMGSVHVEP